ncbi:related to PET100 |uniref:Related to PET100 \|nr:related to PET100 \
MAGPNLELFKFGVYLFFPLAVMVHYGNPAWYNEHVLPIRDQFWPAQESLYKPPRNSDDLKTALEEMKTKRLQKRQARLSEQEQDSNNINQTSSIQSSTQSHSRIASMLNADQNTSQRLV